MKKLVIFTALSLCSIGIWAMDAAMYQWKSHFAYGAISQIVDANDKVFGLASGSLFSVDKSSEAIQTYSKQNGMHGGNIARIGYDPQSKTLIIAYSDGLIDLLQYGTFTAMTDLQQKAITVSKQANNILVEDGLAYFCMPFGIMMVDVKNRLIKDTYYIGYNGAEVNVLDLSFSQDSLFAMAADSIYSIHRKDNMMDYRYWHGSNDLSGSKAFQAIAVWKEQVFVVQGNTLWQRKSNTWKQIPATCNITGMHFSENKLFLKAADKGIYYVDSDFTIKIIPSAYHAIDVFSNNKTYWLATDDDGLVKQTESGTQAYPVNGPLVNMPYRLKIANNRLYMVAGQRWADENPKRDANIMIYDIQQDMWHNIPSQLVDTICGMHVFDLMNVAVDPTDAEHFYVTSFGTGVLECKDYTVLRQYSIGNSPLESAAPGAYEQFYMRADGALFDASGNLWMINAGVENQIHVATPAQLEKATKTGTANWYKMPLNYVNGENIIIHTPQEMWIDNRNPNWKWIPSARVTTGLILLDDNGTPQYSGDDVAVFRNTFVDQDKKTTNVDLIYSAAQDKEGTIWLGLSTGLITIPADVDYKTSNTCERIKIARNDGTGLADYLLETERVTAIAVDGANRKWFGTQSSGVYLISADGEETIEHFTEDNSPLLSNSILSIAIDPQTGRVYIGTGKGLISYQGDSAMPFEDYSTVYAYPNPVYPEYTGVITITGLMDDTIVHITDNAGNLVCETRSNGGTAIWDGKTADGKRVASGVYNVFCNESAEKSHTLIKILVMH